MRSGCRRTVAKAIIRKAIINNTLEELSAPLLKSSLIPYGYFYKPGAPTLKIIVERKLKKRIDTYGAKKKRQQRILNQYLD